jgi:serine/threonine protein kinase/tetratricopeptide (TPR) repeat protein
VHGEEAASRIGYVTLKSGKTVLHFRILEKIGEGGMGEVWRARDTRLDRDVAIKVLPPTAADESERRERFDREARAIAALSHPHVCALYDVGKEGETRYLVMEYLDGDTLADRLRSGAMPASEALRYGAQIAAALAAAHARGIVHRDLKPANVKITTTGVKVLDFGLAKIAAPTRQDATPPAPADMPTEMVTREHTILGTAPYMSPEQARGEAIDHRTDTWSFGVMLCEMLTGKPLFEGGSTIDVLSAVLHAPLDLEALPADLPDAVRSLLGSMLQRDPGRRPAEMSEVARALESGVSSASGATLARPATLAHTSTGPVTATSGADHSIVVLPFTNSSPDPDNEYFSDGLTEEVIADLSKIGALRVISRTTAMRLKDTGKDLATVAAELDVRYALEGSVRKAGNALRITVQLIDTGRDQTLWSDKYSGTLDDVFAIQERVSRSIVEALRLRLSESENRQLEAPSRPNAFVYDTYLRARRDIWSFVPERMERARTELNHALEVVGSDVLLHSALGLLEWQYVNSGISGDRAHLETARRHAEEILRLDPSSAHGPRLLGLIAGQSGDPEGWVRNLRRAVALDPHEPDAKIWLGFGLTFSGRLKEARELFQQQLAVDPLHDYLMFGFGFDAYQSGDWASAIRWYEKGAELSPDHPGMGMVLAQTHASAGDLDRMSAAVEKYSPSPDAHPLATLTHIFHHAMLGEAAEADALTNDAWAAKMWSDFQYTHVMAQAQTALGRTDEALRWLGRATERGFLNAPFLEKVDPLLTGLRGEARFVELMERLRQRWQRFDEAAR